MIDYSFEVQQKTALPSPKNPLLTGLQTPVRTERGFQDWPAVTGKLLAVCVVFVWFWYQVDGGLIE